MHGEIKATPKNGQEKLSNGLDKLVYSLLDFWRWSLSDLMTNATRGILAEFIVATALGIDLSTPRTEWDVYDLITKSGLKIEVKSSAYIQSWAQAKYSDISFSIKPTKAWDENTRMYTGESKRRADVYVFCHLKHKDQKTIDPLKMEQWDFFVVPTKVLDIHFGRKNRLSLSALKGLVNSLPYHLLAEKIEAEN